MFKRMFGVPRIYEESPQIKGFAGLINLGALLWLKKQKLNKIKTAGANTSVTGRICF